METEKLLQELVDKLKTSAGTNLKSVVLYGSAAGGEFHEKYSDLNVLCLLKRLDGAELEKLSEAAAWWVKEGHPAPLAFSQEELQSSAGVFPIEFLDIKAKRRVLYGEDAFAAFDVPMKFQRAAVERELETNLVRLRQSYLAGSLKRKGVMRLMTSSISSFVTLFRHALLVLGEKPPKEAREVMDRLAARLRFDATPFHAIWDVREGKRKESSVDAQATLRAYVENIQRVTEAMHRLLAEPAGRTEGVQPEVPEKQ
jgi:predicted nucleotidyltransferase